MPMLCYSLSSLVSDRLLFEMQAFTNVVSIIITLHKFSARSSALQVRYLERQALAPRKRERG